MKFIKLHVKKDNQEVFVNANMIVTMSEVVDLGMTKLVLTNEVVYVRESIKEIGAMLLNL